MKKIQEGNEERHVPITTNPILTQKLLNLSPKCSIGCVIFFLTSLILAFSALGIPLLTKTKQIIELSVEYMDIW